MNVRMITTLILLLIILIVLIQSQGEGSRIFTGNEVCGLANRAALATLDPGFNVGQSIDTMGIGPFTSCDVSRDNCSFISPSGNSVFIADGAYNSTDGTVFFVDVPSYADGVFQVEPSTCSIVTGTYYSINEGVSQRGIGYDPEWDQIWVGSWNDYYLNQHNATPPYEQIYTNYVGLAIAGVAVDDANDYLFVATNSYPDMLYVFDITGGVLDTLLGSWTIPWQSSTDGYDMAGMGFDDDSGQLVMVNQYESGYGIKRETFDFDMTNGPVGYSYCSLDATSYAWGIALIEDGDPQPLTYYSYNPDIYGFSPPFDVDEYGIPTVYPPYDLICTVTAENDIDMSWSNAEEYDEVRIYHDGDLIAVLPGDATSYLVPNPGIGHHLLGVSGVIEDDESGRAQCEITIYGPSDCFHFNSSDGGWTPGGYAGWEWGEPSYVIDGKAWETVIGANYLNNSCGWLDSPPINLGPEGGWLTVDTYTYVECSYDGWNVQLSTDLGNSWEMIYPIEGYDQGDPYAVCDEGLDGDTNCGYGELESWNFDLTDHPSSTVMVRFLFESDPSLAYTGVIVDNVCMYGGSVLEVMVQCQLLNPDSDGDGVRDVHVGEYMYYSATFINLEWYSVDYGAEHFFYTEQSCLQPEGPVDHFGPECKGTLPENGIATHYYRVRIPANNDLVGLNPFAVEVAAWKCEGEEPAHETFRCCFDVILLPAWEPPPVPEPITDFKIEEVEKLPF